MKSRHAALSLVILLTTGWHMACAEPETNQTAAPTKPNKPRPTPDGDDGEDGDDGDDGSDDGSDDSSSDGSDGAEPVDTSALRTFCERAAETNAKTKLGEYYDKFCADGQPTSVFSLLMKSAYAGSGDPKLKKMGEWVEEKEAKTTTGFFGVGIKMSGSITDYFDKVGPKAGDPQEIRKLAGAGGSTVEIAEVLQQHPNDGKYQVRGWTIEQKSSRQIPTINITVTMHTISRTDQYELEKGSAYLFTSYLTESKATLLTFDTFMAGVKVGDSNYLLIVARLKIDNKGFHSVASDSIRSTAMELVKSMYQTADETLRSP